MFKILMKHKVGLHLHDPKYIFKYLKHNIWPM